ncbi:hypothetical protein [Pseudomonas aeruginosa]|uniref:hypothetical protein n=1 Tax=Pseudomonas aeruginosa TaxID=287 RepID=UPI0018AC808F|nr:hypothetical protein [Pseudomonas aeruginosa]MBF8798108.1 hypothetical protein [Pseudomonas aeruginosa]
MRKTIAIMLGLIISLPGIADDIYDFSQHIVHGPFSTQIYNNSRVYFSKSQDKNHPIYLVMEKNKEPARVVDRYEVSGSDPTIETVFFYRIENAINIIALVSWEINSRGIGTYGKLYQVYAYKDKNGELVRNQKIIKNNAMSGLEGYQDFHDASFKLKTAEEIKKFIQRNFNKTKKTNLQQNSKS